MEKLSFLGIGPRIARIALPNLAITIVLALSFPEVLGFSPGARMFFMVAGALWLATGLALYIATIRQMLPGIRENRLVTTGTYRLCRNPLYTVFILMIIPGVSLLMNSWIVATASLVGYFAFRRYIHVEEEQLERIFGDEFRAYRERTPRFCPWGHR